MRAHRVNTVNRVERQQSGPCPVSSRFPTLTAAEDTGAEITAVDDFTAEGTAAEDIVPEGTAAEDIEPSFVTGAGIDHSNPWRAAAPGFTFNRLPD